ncbi:DUF4625 domain-containing protein [Flammeovirga sp. SJP92]|uniref:DUF4625 domain-containing protein n=1 Tax=Flammeovirga sp. SJP92 TaxID=1775430 RepID=UPI000787884D|nr:DUF4625 domain-containing protein [Flammeovirga sp. SJP92]KXX72570.1 hypothetical protein AVL50_00440 [Flammeovirga sp. SJP92]
MMKKSLTLISLLLIGLFSCNNDTDEGPLPTISNYTIEGEAHDHARLSDEGEEPELEMGGEAHIDAELAGEALQTVLLDIHWGEGHTHSRLNANGEDEPKWTEKIEWKFGVGTEVENGLTPEGVFPNNHDFHQHIDVPEGVLEGEYHFVLHLWDQKGNETQQNITVHVHGHEHEDGEHAE